MNFTVSFICKWCAGHADAKQLKHRPCDNNGCDCQHGTPRVKHDSKH